MWRRLRGVVLKEIVQTFRNKIMLVLILWFYIAEAFMCAYALSFDIRNMPVAYLNQDGTSASRELIDRLAETDAFRLVASAQSESGAEQMLQAGEVQMAIIVPKGFGANIAAKRPTSVQVLLDGVNSNSAAQARNYAFEIVANFERSTLIASGMSVAGAIPVERYWFNTGQSYVSFMVLSMLGLAALITGVIHPAASIVREKELGTIEQLQVTPISTIELFIAKTLPALMIGLVAVFPSLLVTWWFGVPLKGSLILFLALTAIFLLSAISIGVLIASITRTLQQALLLSFFGLFPMLFLSGTMVPRESMPEILQTAAQASPLLYYFEIILGIFMKGSGLHELWPQALSLIVIGFVLFSAAFMIFRRSWNK